MVPISVIPGGSEGDRGIVSGHCVLGISRSQLRGIGNAIRSAAAVATHREPDFDGLFSAWAINVLLGRPGASIYSGNGRAAGIERRVPGLLSALNIALREISQLRGNYVLLDAGAGANRNVGARYEPTVCIDTHFGAMHSRNAYSIFSKSHAAVSTIVTGLIHAERGDSFWTCELGRLVAAGLLLGIMTDCGMNNPTDYGMALYGTEFDIAAAKYLRPKADPSVIGQYVNSNYWSRLGELTGQALAKGTRAEQAVKAFLIEALSREESDMTGSVAERLLSESPQALAVVCAGSLVGGGLKVSFRLNNRHHAFSAGLVSAAIGGMVTAANMIVQGEASWRSGGRVLGGYWPTSSFEQAKQVLSALINQFSSVCGRKC